MIYLSGEHVAIWKQSCNQIQLDSEKNHNQSEGYRGLQILDHMLYSNLQAAMSKILVIWQPSAIFVVKSSVHQRYYGTMVKTAIGIAGVAIELLLYQLVKKSSSLQAVNAHNRGLYWVWICSQDFITSYAVNPIDREGTACSIIVHWKNMDYNTT